MSAESLPSIIYAIITIIGGVIKLITIIYEERKKIENVKQKSGIN